MYREQPNNTFNVAHNSFEWAKEDPQNHARIPNTHFFLRAYPKQLSYMLLLGWATFQRAHINPFTHPRTPIEAPP
jgi:hypothetical protein